MDWMTLSIEIVGALIFCLWIIIPIREYREIYQHFRQQSGESQRDGEARP